MSFTPPTGARSHRAPSPPSGRLAPLLEETTTPRLFAYGTLQFPEVLESLLGRRPRTEPDTARGWRAAIVEGRIYPALVPADDTADGVVVFDLSPTDWRVIDAFEDDIYRLAKITLEWHGACWTYVYNAAEAEPGVRPWDRSSFVDQHLDPYVRQCAEWRMSYSA